MKKVKLTVATNLAGSSTHLELHRSMPGLLWSEFTDVLNDYAKFERGEKGTRFDNWLDKK